MLCHKCGSKVDDDASFCHRCGENIAHGTVGAVLVAIIVLVLIVSGTLKNVFDKLIDINNEIENNAKGAVTMPDMQSADNLFPTTSAIKPSISAESSFAWVEEAHIETEDDFFKSRYIVGQFKIHQTQLTDPGNQFSRM